MLGCLSVQVLVREENLGIHYRFNPPLNRDPLTGFAWHYNSWSRCSSLCAGGEIASPFILTMIIHRGLKLLWGKKNNTPQHYHKSHHWS